jgi:hypothetical protein
MTKIQAKVVAQRVKVQEIQLLPTLHRFFALLT